MKDWEISREHPHLTDAFAALGEPCLLSLSSFLSADSTDFGSAAAFARMSLPACARILAAASASRLFASSSMARTCKGILSELKITTWRQHLLGKFLHNSNSVGQDGTSQGVCPTGRSHLFGVFASTDAFAVALVYMHMQLELRLFQWNGPSWGPSNLRCKLGEQRRRVCRNVHKQLQRAAQVDAAERSFLLCKLQQLLHMLRGHKLWSQPRANSPGKVTQCAAWAHALDNILRKMQAHALTCMHMNLVQNDNNRRELWLWCTAGDVKCLAYSCLGINVRHLRRAMCGAAGHTSLQTCRSQYVSLVQKDYKNEPAPLLAWQPPQRNSQGRPGQPGFCGCCCRGGLSISPGAPSPSQAPAEGSKMPGSESPAQCSTITCEDTKTVLGIHWWFSWPDTEICLSGKANKGRSPGPSWHRHLLPLQHGGPGSSSSIVWSWTWSWETSWWRGAPVPRHTTG